MNRLKPKQRLRVLLWVELVCLAALSIAIVCVMMWQNAAAECLNSAIRRDRVSCRLANQLRQSSDDLTRMVRTYAATGDSRFEDYFHMILDVRDGKAPRPVHYDRVFWDFQVAETEPPGGEDGERASLLALMRRARFSNEEFELLAEAKDRSDKLVELEEEAMNAMKGKFRDDSGAFTILKQPDRELALKILFSEEYHQAKRGIMQPIDEFLTASDNRTSAAIAVSLKEGRVLSSVLSVLLLCLSVLLPLFVLSGYRYHRMSTADLREREARLQGVLNAPLETVALIGRDGTILTMNEDGARRLDLAPDAAIGRNVWDLLPADVAQSRREYGEEVFNAGKAVRFEDERGGIHFANSIYPVLGSDGAEVTSVAVFSQDITERRQRELQVREMARFAELNPAPVLRVDPDGIIISCNPASVEILGKNAKKGSSLSFVLPDLSKMDVKTCIHDNMLLSQEAVVGERSFLFSLRGVSDLGLLYIYGSDITQRKLAGERLAESEEHFRNLMEQSPVSIQIHGLDGKLVQSNAAYARLYALNDETLAQLYEKYNVREDQQAEALGLSSFIERVYAGEDVVFPLYEYNGVDTLKTLNFAKPVSRTCWIETRGFPLRDESGKVTSAVFMSVDTTERKQVQEDLKQSRDYTDHLIETANVMIVSLDAEGRVTHFNPAAETITGYTLPEVRGKNWFSLLVPRERFPEVHEEFGRLMRGGMPRFFENPIITKDGRERYISWSNSEIRKGAEETGIISFGLDITERRRAEEEVHAYQKRLRALAAELTLTEERERRRIASELHDGAAQSLALARMKIADVSETLTGAAAQKLDDASQTVRQSLEQIRSVLLDLNSPSLNEIGLAAALSEWLDDSIGKRHKLRTEFCDRCGEVSLTHDVRVILFRNARELLANVVKHAGAERVSVLMACSGQELRLTVEDDGVGFVPESQDGKLGTEGGFGLFSIRERMADLGGSLELVSAPGQGCKATLVAPLASGEEAEKA